MGPSGTFHLKGNTGLQIEHEVDDQGELSIWFYGGLMVKHEGRFDRYLSHLAGLQELADDSSVAHVHCHLEHLGEVLSRAQHVIYRMLHAMRDQGHAVTIYATGEHPEQSEHLNMSQLFVNGLSRRPGPPVRLIEIRRAS